MSSSVASHQSESESESSDSELSSADSIAVRRYSQAQQHASSVLQDIIDRLQRHPGQTSVTAIQADGMQTSAQPDDIIISFRDQHGTSQHHSLKQLIVQQGAQTDCVIDACDRVDMQLIAQSPEIQMIADFCMHERMRIPFAPRNKSLAAKHLERIVSFAIHHPTQISVVQSITEDGYADKMMIQLQIDDDFVEEYDLLKIMRANVDMSTLNFSDDDLAAFIVAHEQQLRQDPDPAMHTHFQKSIADLERRRPLFANLHALHHALERDTYPDKSAYRKAMKQQTSLLASLKNAHGKPLYDAAYIKRITHHLEHKLHAKVDGADMSYQLLTAADLPPIVGD